jgi:histidine phosphotransfer protein HptB
MIDWLRIDDLTAEVGKDALAEIVGMFLEETDEVIALLQDATPTVENYHFLKGSALNLGLRDLATVSQRGELEARAGTSNPATRAEILLLYAASRKALLQGLAARGI